MLASVLAQSGLVTVRRLERQHLVVDIVPDVIAHLHDVADEGQARGLFDDPAHHSVLHLHGVVLYGA